MPTSSNRGNEPLLRPKTIFIGILVILAIILIMQNSFILPFRFLFWKAPASLRVVFPGVFLLGFVTGYLVRMATARSRQKSR